MRETFATPMHRTNACRTSPSVSKVTIIQEMLTWFGPQASNYKRGNTSFAPVGNSAGLPEPSRRPSPATGQDADMLLAKDPYLDDDAEKFHMYRLGRRFG
jgi:hypothetical protein